LTLMCQPMLFMSSIWADTFSGGALISIIFLL
jgi:hypothetical protein